MPSTSYSVTITALGAAAPSDGFIDHKKIEQYLVDNPALVLTYAQSTTKERANQRYLNLINGMQLLGNIYVTNIVAAGASATAAPTSFAFTAIVERGADVLVTGDETNGNAPITGAAALRRAIARSLLVSSTENGEIYDPTQTSSPGNSALWVRYGQRITEFTVGAAAANLTAAEAAVTVTAL